MNLFSFAKNILCSFLLIGVLFLFSAQVQATSENLILNGNLEQTTSGGQPQDWTIGRWGTNTAVFTYPSVGEQNSKGAKVTLTSYTNGDAKWKPKEVNIIAGHEYQFQDRYMSNIESYVTLQYKMVDGSVVYKDIARPREAPTFTLLTVFFTAPPGAVSVTIFHLINKVGSLTVDTYELFDVTPPSPPPATEQNLIVNPQLEYTKSSGLPIAWSQGRWGTNTTEFTYPTVDATGGKAARIQMSSYTNGDAKWYFDDVDTTEGSSYEFTHSYTSNRKTYVAVRFFLNNGSYSYVDISAPEASSGWKSETKYFTAPMGAVSFTVFHLIKGVGFLEIDNYNLKKLSSDPTKFSTGMVSLNFDDGWRSTYENAIPVLNAAGFKSTQFIITQRLSPEYPGYMRASEVLAMQAQGHEIGAHTRTHRDLTTLSVDQMRAEVRGGRDDLLAIGATPVNFFAYPLGAYNNQVKLVVQEAGFLAARSSDGGDNMKNQDIWALRRQPLTVNTTFEQVKSYIDKALNDKTWLILLFHEVNYTGNYYSVTPELFSQIIDYLQQKNIAPTTLQQGWNAMTH